MKEKSFKKKDEAKKSTKQGIDVLKTFTFPEHSISIQAVDMKDAKSKLQESLKGVKKL